MRGTARLLRAYPEVIPGLLAVAVFLAWAPLRGAFEVGVMTPGALFLVGLAAVSALVFRGRLRDIPVATLVALGLLAAFTAWMFLSVSWAADKAIAWDGANRMVGYLAAFGLFAVLPWRSFSAAVVLGGFSLGLAVLGMVATLTASGAGEPEIYFISSRFLEPTGYHNGSAALYLVGLWPALYLASRREVSSPLRGLMLACAGVLLQLAVIPQSRGALIAFVLAVLLYLLLVPGRMRSVLVMVPVGLAALASGATLLEVYDAVPAGDAGQALRDAFDAIVLSALGLLAVGTALGLVDRQVRVPRRLVVIGNAGLAVVAAAGIALGVTVFVREEGDPVAWADDRWEDFKGGSPAEFEGGSRLTGSLGTDRYDFWRVSIDEFADSPVTGIGADNFAIEYLRERRSHIETLHPHSLPIRVLLQTGLVGSLLLAGALLAALGAAARVRWRHGGTGLSPGLAAAAVVAFLYWFAHSGAEWLWVLPAVSAPALAWLAMAGRIRSSSADPRSAATAAGDSGGELESAPPGERLAARIPPLVRRGAIVVTAAAVLAFLAASLALPWMASRDVQIASSNWGADPDAALERLDRARGLNFLSAEPDLVAGTIAARLEDEPGLRAAFERALERRPESWYANLQLGAHAARHGRQAAAVRHLREASRLNPGDELIADALRRAGSGREISLRMIDRDLVERVCQRVGRASELERCR